MATYAIGDIQGCYDELRRLVDKIGFDPARDRLWLVGDLVNRGPRSLEVLRYVRDLGDAAVTVLGNHDLALLCVIEGYARLRSDDTIDDVLAAPDRDELADWLRGRQLMHRQGRYVMVHAGLLPQWSLEEALVYAHEVERALAAPDWKDFLARLYGNEPREWHDKLEGIDRLRGIVNAMTRMRFCTPEGEMELTVKGRHAPIGTLPWFDARAERQEDAIVCGHWSTLGLRLTPRLLAIDTGCVWGGSLTALRLEDRALYQVECAGYMKPDL
ncbi:MAG: symmetrical bis(5'-nucleosyl)-tetraphosphatase [Proteobacteria bacterium]|nr:symmetrical bis(5'-nucleosyl)-tetraphosphatase [Pseudomonadota bacterium]